MIDSMQGPIPRRKLSHAVIDHLLRLWESGSVKPGDKMPSERELMERFQVGRPAIREAMHYLENMGLIKIQHGERARVLAVTPETMFQQLDRMVRLHLSLSPKSLENLRQARQLFEGAMARLAAGQAGPKELEALKEKLNRMKGSFDDSESFMLADMEFHRLLADIPGNPIFSAISRSLLKWLVDYHTGLVRVPGLEGQTTREHEAILDRIARGDGDGAAKAMSDHILRVNRLYHRKSRPDPGPKDREKDR